MIYNGLPPELRAVIGGPAADQSADVPILNDGVATVLNVVGTAPTVPGVARQDFTIQFDQVIPKPFCASGPSDLVLAQGPVRLRGVFISGTDGAFKSEFHADAQLRVTPVDPTGVAVGTPYAATVGQAQAATLTDAQTEASERLVERLLPVDTAGHGELSTLLDVVSGGPASAHATTRCGT